jgi:hypothetical protein
MGPSFSLTVRDIRGRSLISVRFAFFHDQSVGFQVDGTTGADGDDVDDIAGGNAVDDSKPAHAKAPQSGWFIFQRLSDFRFDPDAVESGPELALDRGMRLPKQPDCAFADAEPDGLALALSHGSVEQFFQ